MHLLSFRVTRQAGAVTPRQLVLATLFVAVLAAVVIGWRLYLSASGTSGSAVSTPSDKPSRSDGKTSGGRPGRGGDGKPVPVSVAKLEKADLPETIQVVGTATALQTVVVRPRVDGLLQSVQFREGDRVAANDVLAQIDPQPFEVAVKSAEGALERDRALLRNAELDLQRFEDLWQKESVSRQQLDTQRALVQQLRGTVQASQASLDTARLNLSYTRVRSPISGRLGLRQVDAGNAVRASDVNGLVTVTQDNPIAVVFSVTDAHIQRIQAGQRAGRDFGLKVSDRSGQVLLKNGRLQGIDNALDATTGTLRLKAVFQNPEQVLFPNQFVNVQLTVGQKKNVLVAPVAAIQRGAEGAFLAVVLDDNTIRITPVQVGLTEGERAEVSGETLEAGQAVVTAGVDRLRNGSRVEVQDGSSAAPDAETRREKRGGRKGP